MIASERDSWSSSDFSSSFFLPQQQHPPDLRRRRPSSAGPWAPPRSRRPRPCWQTSKITSLPHSHIKVALFVRGSILRSLHTCSSLTLATKTIEHHVWMWNVKCQMVPILTNCFVVYSSSLSSIIMTRSFEALIGTLLEIGRSHLTVLLKYQGMNFINFKFKWR